jgi:hypothetical protein
MMLSYCCDGDAKEDAVLEGCLLEDRIQRLEAIESALLSELVSEGWFQSGRVQSLFDTLWL